MLRSRRTPAQLSLALLLTACADSHGRLEDGGREDGPVVADAGAPIDAGPRRNCDPDRAEAMVCRDALCDGLPSWHWNGDDCFWIDCGACVGEDCSRSVTSREQCLAEHASCEAAMCRTTGGTWRWWGQDCAHFECGFPRPILCTVGGPACDCGFHRSFDAERGCVEDSDCPFSVPIFGEELCTASGGTWGNVCCSSECGVPCGDDCLAPACTCGPTQVFERSRGCVEASRCFERHDGETCNAPARCEEGTICCQHCGGAGCFGDPTCQRPVCDDDPNVDTCGNDLLAP